MNGDAVFGSGRKINEFGSDAVEVGQGGVCVGVGGCLSAKGV